ncbi:MAG: phage Gp37/Gp68 family protein [Verrucomicrobiota bacterium]|nr:phage Gp37/Gp68 family protein [Verrucomicrobiota bacterium]
MSTNIEWTDATWNPVTGCTKVSQGCKHCYAERMATRLAGRYGYSADQPFRVTLRGSKLEQPFHWREPRMVFVCSMGDLFHDDVPDGFIDRVFGVIRKCPQHTFQILTKRPHGMCEYALSLSYRRPPSNVWLGTSVENQDAADSRIHHLLNTPAAVRFLSLEPLLGPLPGLNLEGIHWVIVGGESGPGARPMHPEWARDIRDQCVAAGVPFFFKQWGGVNKKRAGRLLDGREWNEMPPNGGAQEGDTERCDK